MSNEVREYIVTTSDTYDSYVLHEELVLPEASTESDAIPERAVDIAQDMYGNPTSTAYFLTSEEAETLLSDPRVIEVIDPDDLAISKFAFQTGSFDKTVSDTGDVQNWGLLRHINQTNIFGTSTLDPGGTYDYVLDGTGVDVVIVDSGIQANHPEFFDADGVSRVKQIDWYAASGFAGTMPTGFYTDYDGHGTHVAATVAGKTFGWAKNADVYAMKLAGLEAPRDPGVGINANTAMQLILGWHNNKTNGRPTVINNSWGYVWFWDTSDDTASVNGTTYSSITSHTYRGSTINTGITKDTSKGLIGQQISATEFSFGRRLSFMDSWISSMISAGIIVCNAAGNDRMKIDVSGGLDYDNSVILSSGPTTINYHRGSSPNCESLDGFEVGAFGINFVSTAEAKSSYSSAGPGVEVYAAGDRILSAMSQTNDDDSNTPYYDNSSFKQQRLSGTSMASPQVAGICALLLQAHPDWSPSQVKRWIVNYSQELIYSTGLDNDYTVSSSILGGSGKIPYLPMNGQIVFSLSEV